MKAMNLRRTLSILAILLTAACASGSLRHVAVGAVTTLTDALIGYQKYADTAVATGTKTSAWRQALAQKLLPALQGTSDLNDTVAAWKPGDPIPTNLQNEAVHVQALTTDVSIAAGADAATQAAINGFVAQAEGAIILILTRTGSGVPTPIAATPGAAPSSGS